MPKVILFNAPPRSGKDSATRFAVKCLGNRGKHYRFAGPLKDAVHAMFGMAGIATEYFDAVKDEPNARFFGMSPRQAYIWFSEEVVKPKFGKDFFALVAVNTIKDYGDNVVVISDCGFAEEVNTLIEAFGAENVTMVYLKRKGTAFKTDKVKDSRGYVTKVDCEQFTIENDGTMDELREKVECIVNAK